MESSTVSLGGFRSARVAVYFKRVCACVDSADCSGKKPQKKKKKMWNSETDPEMMNFVDALDIAVSP